MNLSKKDVGKFVIIDFIDKDYFKNSKTGEIIVFTEKKEALETCGMYEFENSWVVKLEFNHIEEEIWLLK